MGRFTCLAMLVHGLTFLMPQTGLSQVEAVGAESAAPKSTQNRQISDLASKVGPDVVRQWRRNRNIEQDNEIDASLVLSSIERVQEDYAQFIREYHSAVAYSRPLMPLAGGLFGAAAARFAGPPVMLLGSVVGAVVGNVVADKLEEQGQSMARQILQKNKDAILEAANRTYGELAANPNALRGAFVKNTSLLSDLRDRAEGDPVLWGFAVDLLTDTLVNTTEAQLDAAAGPEANVEKFMQFAGEFSAELSETAKLVDSIGNSLDGFHKSISELGSQLNDLGAEHAMVADFVFGSMSATQKLEMLNRGYMDRLFRCPGGGSTCEGARLKEATVSSLEEAAGLEEDRGRLKSQLSGLAEAIDGMTNVHAIAGNLGVHSPELSEMIGYGNIAGNAILQFSQANYLGALASITSVFGKRAEDPNAVRFRFLMNYLDQQFRQINSRLNQALENQARIMEGLVALSEQMERSFERMDRSLERIEFEQARSIEGIRSLVQRAWRACHSVAAQAMERALNGGNYNFIDANTMLISETGRRNIIQTSGETQVLPCLATMQENFSSLNATRVFGNFVGMDWVMAKWLEAEVPGFVVRPEQTLMQGYMRDVFEPARTNVEGFVDDHAEVTLAEAFVLLTLHVESTDDWNDAVVSYADGHMDFVCWNSKTAGSRLFPLLCGRDNDPDPNVNSGVLLSSPVLAVAAIDIATWVHVMAQFADVRDQESSRWVSYEEMLEAAGSGDLDLGASSGEYLVERAISMLDVAIASYAMVYGPLGATQIVSEIKSGNVSGGSIKALRQNPFLAANAAQLLLEEQIRTRYPDRPNFVMGWYLDSYEAWFEPNKEVVLEKTFPGLTLVGSESSGPQIAVEAHGEVVRLDLPTPAAFSEGQLYFPVRYYELLEERRRLAERLYMYRMLDGFAEEEREALGIALTQQ